MPDAATSPDSGELAIVKLKVHRSILLLDLAAQQARVLMREISNAPRRLNLESQVSIYTDAKLTAKSDQTSRVAEWRFERTCGLRE